MDSLWILISVFAALMQAVRTAGQKRLNAHLSTTATTYVRSIFGLPFLVVYLIVIHHYGGRELPTLSTTFWLYSFGAALAQVVATWLLIYLFTLRNFAVGSMLPKSDIMMTAVLGSLFFSEAISAAGWIAIVVTLAGVFLIGGGKTDSGALLKLVRNPFAAFTSRPIQVGLATGLAFTFSYLFLREASLSLGFPFIESAAWTVVAVIIIQVAVVGVWLWIREPTSFPAMWQHRKPGFFVGITSALGSIGWFTAMTLQNASYVKAVGQVEAVFALLISWFYFREKSSAAEFIGIALIAAGVLIFLL